MPKPVVVVVGAGVIGLTTAILAQQAGYDVEVVAEFFPGDDLNTRYTSGWAGAHHVSTATHEDLRLHRFDAVTFAVMKDLIASDPTVPLMFRPQIEYRREARGKQVEGKPDQFQLLASFMPDFRFIEKSALPAGIDHGVAFTSIMIDTPRYLLYLLGRFLSKGGRTHRRVLTSLDQVAPIFSSRSKAGSRPRTVLAIFNCTGLGARSLASDATVRPKRGQTVLIRAPWVETAVGIGPLPGANTWTYIIPRQNGDVILGGTGFMDDWEVEPRLDVAQKIMERTLALCPELLPPAKRGSGKIEDLDVVAFGCGLRPVREAGVRIEADVLDGIPLLHHYGHGGYGFQASWGSAEDAIKLLKETVPLPAQARL